MAAPRRWRGAALWAAVVVVAGLALAVGAGAFSPGHGQPASLYQRTLEVAGQYRCPVCASESAAVSDAAEAVEIRSLIQGWLKKGDSQAQIRGYLVSDYGTSILEKPPASGLNTLVWALPAVAAALGIIGLGFGFARWRRANTPPMAAADGSVLANLAGADLAGADLGRADLVKADLARADLGKADLGKADLGKADLGKADLGKADLGKADLGKADLGGASLSASAPVQDRLFDVSDDELAPVEPQADGPKSPARPLYRRIAPALGAVLIVLAGALWLVDRSSSQRLPGGTVTGGVTGIDEELQQASSLAVNDPSAALAIYDGILAGDPNQPVALSAEGWIYAEAGYVTRGENLLQKAETADPTYDPPHFYRGLVLLEDQRQPAAAIKELKWYLAHGPDPTMTKTAKTALAQAEANL
jgi:cytochrome c-type biogenesis protein CcmH/NrfF